jgi:predicted Zn-dependent peptidase
VEQDQAVKLAREHFSGGVEARPTGLAKSESGLSVSEGEPSINVARVEIQQTDQSLAGVIIGFKSQSVISQPQPALDVLDTMTSGWGYPTGYLYEALRGRGLVYVVHAIDFPGVRADLPGTFLVYAGCDPTSVNEVIDLILQNIARCQGSDKDMQRDWFERAKQLLTTGEAMDRETAAQQAETAALDELCGLGYRYRERFTERVNAVTIEQVRRIARAKLGECVVTVSTPRPDLVVCKPGERTYKSFPPVELTPRGVQHDAAK